MVVEPGRIHIPFAGTDIRSQDVGHLNGHPVAQGSTIAGLVLQTAEGQAQVLENLTCCLASVRHLFQNVYAVVAGTNCE